MATLSYSLSEQDERPVNHKSKGSNIGSAKASSLHSKKSTKSHLAALKRQKELEVKAAKEKQKRAHRMYELWSHVKQEERDEYYSYLREKVSLQHELIKQQDQLFRKKQESLEQRRQQVKEAKRLARLAKSTEYADFVKDSLAMDKLRSASLKSHACVISSHQPSPRLPYRSEGEFRRPSGGPCETADRLTSEGSELQASEFADLLDLPFDVQLKLLLGSTAESYLNPTLREGAKKTLDPLIAKQTDRGIGAKELWNILRNRSCQRLEREDSLISSDVKNAYTSFLRECLRRNVQPIMRSFCSDNNGILPPDDQLSESHLIQDVYYTRHRLDLMFRIAHMNKDKTRLLVRSMEAVDTDGPGMIPIDVCRSRLEDSRLRLTRAVQEQETKENTPRCISSSQYHISPALLGTENEKHNTEEHAPKEKVITVGAEKMVFLTEDMARCEGEFSKRHKAPGTKLPSDTSPAKTSNPRATVNSRMSLSAPITSSSMRSEQRKKVKSWEPLSLSALLEYKPDTEAPGVGKFRNGQICKWNTNT